MHVGFLWNSKFASQNYHNGRKDIEHIGASSFPAGRAWRHLSCLLWLFQVLCNSFLRLRGCTRNWLGPASDILWKNMLQKDATNCASYHNIYLQISTKKGHGPLRYPSSNACNPFSLCSAAMCRKYEFLQRTRFSYCNAEYGCGTVEKTGTHRPLLHWKSALHSWRKFQTWNPNVDTLTRQLWLQNDLRKRLPSILSGCHIAFLQLMQANSQSWWPLSASMHVYICRESADKLFNPMVYWFLAIVDCCEAGEETQTHVFLKKKWNQCKTCNITSIRFVVLGVCIAASLQSIRYFEMYLSDLVSFATSNVEPFGPLAPAWSSKMAPDDQCQ